MAGSTDLFLDINTSLEQNLKGAEKSLGNIDNIADSVNKTMKDMNKTTNMLNDNYDDIEEASEKIAKNTGIWKKLIGGLGGLIKKIGIGFGAFSLFDVVRDTFVLNKNMTNLSYRMGEGAAGVQKLTKAVTETAYATGTSVEAATEWVTTLTKLRVGTKDITELATASSQFARITGASNDSVAQLTGKLHTMGKLGTKDITNIMKGIVGVQRAFGLTEEDVAKLNDSIIESTVSLKHMGKSADEIAKFSMGVTKLAGAFVSVGMEAESATKLIQKMLDPGQIEDNAMLYAKLGISMQDAIEGNIDPEKMIGGLKNLKSEMEGMNRIAANELAKTMGFTYDQIMQMSEIDMTSNMGGAVDDLSASQDEQKVAQEKLTSSLNKFKSILVDIGSKFMPMINKAAEWLTANFDKILDASKGIVITVSDFVKSLTGGGLVKIGAIVAGVGIAIFILLKKVRKKFFTLATDMGKALSSGIEESIDMSSQKSAAMMEKRMKASTNSYMQDLQQRIIKGTDYAATQASASYYKAMGGTNMTKLGKSITKWTGEWVDGLASGAKPVSMIDTFIGKTQNKLKENLKINEENSAIEKNALRGLILQREERKKIYDARIEELSKLDDATPRQKREMDRLVKMSKKEGEFIADKYNKIKDSDDRLTLRQNKAFAALSTTERKLMSERLKADEEEFNNRLRMNDENKDSNELELNMLNRQKETLSELLITEDKKIKSGKLSSEQQLVALNRRKELIEQQKQTNQLIGDELQEKERIAKIEEDLLESAKKREEIQEQLGDANAGDTGVVSKGLGTKMQGLVESLAGNFMSKVNNGFAKVGDSFRNAVTAGKELINPSNWKKAISAAGDGSFIKGLGSIFKKGAKGFGDAARKMGGPIMLLIGPLLAMTKGMDGFKAIIEKLKTAFGKVMEKLMPIIEQKILPIFMKLVDAIMPMVPMLVDILVPVIEIMGGVLKALLPIMLKLVKLALPPLLIVLGNLVKGVGKLTIFMMELPTRIKAAFKKSRDEEWVQNELRAARGGFDRNKFFEENGLDLEKMKELQDKQRVWNGFDDFTKGNVRAHASQMVFTKEDQNILDGFINSQEDLNRRAGLAEDEWNKGDHTTAFGTVYNLAETLQSSGEDMIEAGKNFGEAAESLSDEVNITPSGSSSSTSPLGNAVEGLTRRLYPAIIEATSSGFVKTQDAQEKLSGDPEKVREAQQDETNVLLKQIAQLLEAGATLSKEQLDALNASASKAIEPVVESVG